MSLMYWEVFSHRIHNKMFSEGIPLNENMTYEEFVRQNDLEDTDALTRARAFTLYMRRVYGDDTQDDKYDKYNMTYLKVKVDGHYQNIIDYKSFYNLWQYYQLNDCVSLHKVTAVRYNKKYRVYNVRLNGRPGLDMWYSYPKERVKVFGIPQARPGMFQGTWVRVKNDKIVREEEYMKM